MAEIGINLVLELTRMQAVCSVFVFFFSLHIYLLLNMIIMVIINLAIYGRPCNTCLKEAFFPINPFVGRAVCVVWSGGREPSPPPPTPTPLLAIARCMIF